MDEDAVVTADWLATTLDDVRVVDVRDAWEYDGIGHVPGAVNIPFDAFRAEEGAEGMLPSADDWAELLGEAGITADDTVVAYDDTHGVFAARFLVTALLYGHEDLHLLNGDFSAWQREHEVSQQAPDVEQTTYEVRKPEATPLVGADEVAAAREDDDAVLVDTRDPEEYEAGHIPGAVNLDWRELVDEETRGLKDRAEVGAILDDRGIVPEKRIVLYCNTARRISHTYVVLRWMGYEDVAFYEGSLTAWLREGREVTGDVTVEDVR
ncbi:MAG: sulfurtransferase [Halobacteriaceae archaeon]